MQRYIILIIPKTSIKTIYTTHNSFLAQRLKMYLIYSLKKNINQHNVKNMEMKLWTKH